MKFSSLLQIGTLTFSLFTSATAFAQMDAGVAQRCFSERQAVVDEANSISPSSAAVQSCKQSLVRAARCCAGADSQRSECALGGEMVVGGSGINHGGASLYAAAEQTSQALQKNFTTCHNEFNRVSCVGETSDVAVYAAKKKVATANERLAGCLRGEIAQMEEVKAQSEASRSAASTKKYDDSVIPDPDREELPIHKAAGEVYATRKADGKLFVVRPWGYDPVPGMMQGTGTIPRVKITPQLNEGFTFDKGR